MATAFLAAKRSKDPCTQVGACIVNKDKIIVGIGYNGFPHGCSDDVFPWRKNSESPLENKYFYGECYAASQQWPSRCHKATRTWETRQLDDLMNIQA